MLGSQLSASLEMQEDKVRSDATAIAQIKVRIRVWFHGWYLGFDTTTCYFRIQLNR